MLLGFELIVRIIRVSPSFMVMVAEVVLWIMNEALNADQTLALNISNVKSWESGTYPDKHLPIMFAY